MKQLKNLFFIGLLCLLANTVLAQETQLERTFGNTFGVPLYYSPSSKFSLNYHNFEYVGKGEMVMVYNEFNCTKNNIHYLDALIKIDEKGEYIWHNYVYSYNDIEILENGSMYCIDAYLQGPQPSIRCQRISADGEYMGYFIMDDINATKIEAFDNNDFVVTDDEQIVSLYSANGTALNRQTLETNVINDLIIKNNIEILITADSSLYILDSLINVEDTIAFEERVKHIDISENNTLLMFEDSLVWLDNEYNIYDTQDFSSTFSELLSVAMKENGDAWLLGKDIMTNETRIEFVPLPFTLTPPYTVIIEDSLVKGSDIKLSENNFIVGGHEHIGEVYHPFIKTFSQNDGQTTEKKHDIEIISANIPSFEIYDNFFAEEAYTKQSVDIVVKNNGKTPIYSFNISIFIPASFEVVVYEDFAPIKICPDVYYSQRYSDVNLMPQETMIVTSDTISRYNFGGPIDACIWVKNVNNALDDNRSDNEFCGTLVESGISENFIVWKTNIFPNPTKYEFAIDIEEEVFEQAISKKLTIFNNLGRKVFENTLKNANETINIQGFSEGIYIVQLNMDGKLWTEKLMKY
ncbi:MAG: T9SS type A sorting domain-containing protein [Chitinophagales bacterium]